MDELKKLKSKRQQFGVQKESFDYQHEAFALMEYGCESCGKVEVVWNSRDGVTPFMIRCQDCRGTMRHINWNKDQFAPNHIPPIGSRVFFSCTNIHEIFQDTFDNYTKEVWERIKDKWLDYCSDRYDLIWKTASHAVTDELRFEHPHIAIVTEKNQETFMSRHAKISKRLDMLSQSLRGGALSTTACWSRQLAAKMKKHDIMERERIKMMIMEAQDATKEIDNKE